MITAQQTRAARALLGWTQEMLADEAKISLTALKRMESANGLRVFESTADQVRRALEAAGIVFINSGPHIGVMIDESRRQSQDRKPA
ncbi:helix-turn-helix transcriptional regulator [Paracoccus onubensis]|uniref:helix-turn-helix domain-containing protein n=1 Tax=Paracoccus onubensis TaxID=1675788 RepID=UPI00272EFC0C|nr:helix-turn-helix transcriptional regulator [Paracoccus onubensis]MDP0926549.1 helix-turn-helix transcriptional regulator [Paracoccus onubensis]